MPSSLCSVRCYCHGVPGFHTKSRPELQKKPLKALWVDLWRYCPPASSPPSLLTCHLPPARKPTLIGHNLVLLSCTHISLRTHVVFYYHKESQCTAYDTAVCKSLLRWLRALTLPDGFWQMLVFMCSATTPLRHDILPFLLSSTVSPLQSWTFSTGDNLLLNILS